MAAMKPVTRLKRADPVLAALIARTPDKQLDNTDAERPDDHYGSLLRTITGQQLSVKAAAKIYQRVLDFFGGEIPTPQQILDADPDALKAAGGLSRAKTNYLRSLAEHVINGELELHKLDRLPDDDVIAELVAVKGLGVWSAHMFLMFHLSREDVLPTGDLGIRKAIMIEYGLDELPSPAEMVEIAEPWRPHRTLACLYLWASIDATPDA
jgi:DNA-3-methyladenine glycosylase II